MDSRKVGILGGGQLGRMLVEAAQRLNINTVILDAPNAPAKQINATNSHIDGAFNDSKLISALADKCDVLTIEIEHVDADALAQLAVTHPHVEVHPSAFTIKTIQDKYLQKSHLTKYGISTAVSEAVESNVKSLQQVGEKFGYPYMLKARTLAYDGRGNFVVHSPNDAAEALKFLGDRPLYAEKWAPFVKELAVMVLRSKDGEVFAYPTVETIHKNNVCHLVYAPAPVSELILSKAKIMAEKAIKSFTGAGIFGVEMFLLPDGELLVNEIAPRPHNSGHYTIDANVTSQFEAHIRAILDLPLPKGFTNLSTPSTHAIMLNVLGDAKPNEEVKICHRALETPGASVYLYGKSTRNGRKMGHINIIGSDDSELEKKLNYITGTTNESKIINGDQEKPLVGIIMGSDSDLPVMAAGAEILEKFNIPFEITIVSAHRTVERMTEYTNSAVSRGLKTIIAGAGGAAHLPGMVAAQTTLPVIGVPVRGSNLEGLDSLLSIVQMPRGVPVATVAINNSTNAALIAVKILSLLIPEVQQELVEYQENMKVEVLEKAEKLETIGYKEYLKRKNI